MASHSGLGHHESHSGLTIELVTATGCGWCRRSIQCVRSNDRDPYRPDKGMVVSSYTNADDER